jgi:hypothetical protein
VFNYCLAEPLGDEENTEERRLVLLKHSNVTFSMLHTRLSMDIVLK